MNEGKKVGLYTLGCKLNFSETSAIGRLVEQKGFEPVSFEQVADLYVINTCSVTENADKKCRYFVRQALRQNPDAYIVVIGCYAQLKPQEIASIKGVDLVLGAAEKFRLPEILQDLSKNPCGQVKASAISEANFFSDAYSVDDRTRAFLKIQDGCDYKCSFCTIPLARGKSRSDLPENILKNASILANKGIKEIVLTGVNTGDYGKGLGLNIRFYDIIQQLDNIQGIERFRISSIEPNLLSNEIIAFVAKSKKFVPHFHIPLQSGSDKILSLMKRRYKRQLYADRVAFIKDQMPHACIGVDVITGFPGETEEDFMETFQFLHSLDISYLHVFTYSERANTLAAEMPNAVPYKVREERTNRLRNLSEKKRNLFYSQFIGKEAKVLFEASDKEGVMFGFTENYIKVNTNYDPTLVNQLTPVLLGDYDEHGNLKASVVEKIF